MICSFVRETHVSNSDDIYIKIPTTDIYIKNPGNTMGPFDATRLMGGAVRQNSQLGFFYCRKHRIL